MSKPNYKRGSTKRKAGKPSLLLPNDPRKRVGRSFSIRGDILEQFELAQKQIGLSLSRVVETQIENYLTVIGFWPVNSHIDKELLPSLRDEN